MRSILLVLCFLCSSLTLSMLRASQEGIARISSFTIESGGVGDSGPIRLSGKQMNEEISSLNIQAFGKDFVLNQSQLVPLGGMPVNGIQLSGENGYKQTGGKTLYILFSKGFTSGIQASKLLTLKESGQITVQDQKSK